MADHEHVATIKRFYEAYNRGDYEGATALAHPEVEVVRIGGFPSIKGHEAIVEWMKPDALTDPRIEPHEFTLGENRVLVDLTFRARGAGSGIDATVEGAQVFEFKGDKVIRTAFFTDRDEARAAFEAPPET